MCNMILRLGCFSWLDVIMIEIWREISRDGLVVGVYVFCIVSKVDCCYFFEKNFLK